MLLSSGISWKSGVLIVRYSQEKEWRNEYLLFSIDLRTLQLLITWEPLVQVGFSAKCTSPNEHFNQIEMSHVWFQTDFPRSHHMLHCYELPNVLKILVICYIKNFFETPSTFHNSPVFCERSLDVTLHHLTPIMHHLKTIVAHGYVTALTTATGRESPSAFFTQLSAGTSCAKESRL